MEISQEEYYTAPADHIFEDIKTNSIKIWKTYDDKFGYATEKISRIKDLKNIQDNALSIAGMFDFINQQKLLVLIKDESKEWLAKFLDPSNYGW